MSRFNEKNAGCLLGPGQYVNKSGMGRAGTGVIGKAASASFKTQERGGLFVGNSGAPGPGDYLNDRNFVSMGHTAEKHRQGLGNKKKMAGFSVNTKRFYKDDTLPPGPGQYKAPDSCVIHNKGHAHHGYKSGTARELNLEHNKSFPGVGDYNMKDHLTIGVQKIQGGAPNNFLILTKNVDPTIRKVEPKMSPRIPETIDPSKGLGPGSYFKNSKVYNLHQLKSANLI